MNEELIQSNLSSMDPKKNMAAILFIQKRGNLTHLRMVLDAVKKSNDASIKKAAIQVATQLIKVNLLEHFSEISSKIREGLATILKSLDPRIIDSIALDLKSPDESLRFGAIRVLGLLGQNPRIRALLKELLLDRNQMVRATAVSLMKSVAENLDINEIAPLLKDKDTRVVANCIEAIEAMGSARLIQVLLRFKSHINNRIRGNAIKALWNLGHKDVLSDLKNMIENRENFLMRATACWVIGEVGTDTDYDFLELLASVASDEEKLVRENVIKAQLKIGGDAVEMYLKTLSDPQEVEEVKKLMAGPQG